jgi:hypothetical protein
MLNIGWLAGEFFIVIIGLLANPLIVSNAVSLCENATNKVVRKANHSVC